MAAFKGVTMLGKWVLTLGTVGALLATAYFINKQVVADRAREGDKAAKAPPKFVGGTIKLSKQYAASFGLKAEAAKEIEWVPKRARVWSSGGQSAGHERGPCRLRGPASQCQRRQVAGPGEHRQGGRPARPTRRSASARKIGWTCKPSSTTPS